MLGISAVALSCSTTTALPPIHADTALHSRDTPFLMPNYVICRSLHIQCSYLAPAKVPVLVLLKDQSCSFCTYFLSLHICLWLHAVHPKSGVWWGTEEVPLWAAASLTNMYSAVESSRNFSEGSLERVASVLRTPTGLMKFSSISMDAKVTASNRDTAKLLEMSQSTRAEPAGRKAALIPRQCSLLRKGRWSPSTQVFTCWNILAPSQKLSEKCKVDLKCAVLSVLPCIQRARGSTVSSSLVPAMWQMRCEVALCLQLLYLWRSLYICCLDPNCGSA